MEDSTVSLPEVEALAKEFKEFAYIVSHDLSAPLRAVVEFSRLLQAEQKGLSEEGKVYLSFITESGKKMQDMLGGLLEYSRLSTMAKPLVKVDCNSIVQHCLIVLQDKIKASNAHLEIADLPHIKGDADQLMQLFIYLLENAIKFHTKEKTPYVSISAERIRENWVFTVKDNGIGIAPEFYDRIFQPFQRLHTDSEYPGVGIGLTLAKKIVEHHGGRMLIESSPKMGSSFGFTIPYNENI